jgi:hypothetical protein
VGRVRVPLRLLTACALAVAPAVALAAAPLPNVNSPKLWATIDACSPAGRPGAVGIRGSLPGTGDAAEQMYMQFRIEYQRAHRWVDVGPQAETGWEALGAASARSREAGQDFTLAASAMHSYLLRGVVTYQWRLHGHVLFTTIRSTSAGHRPGAGADPRGYSAADCRIEAKRRGSLVMTPVTPRPASRSSSAASLTVHT